MHVYFILSTKKKPWLATVSSETKVILISFTVDVIEDGFSSPQNFPCRLAPELRPL